MRSLLALVLIFFVAACESEPIGAPCTINSDCDRSATPTTTCFVRGMGRACANESGGNCLCCPIAPPAGVTVPMGCLSTSTIDVVAVDTRAAVDSPSDSPSDAPTDSLVDAPATMCPMPCTAGMYCRVSTCVPLGQAGQSCGDDTQCATGYCGSGGVCLTQFQNGQPCARAAQCGTSHCVSGYCCNSACTGAGLSCNIGPDFAGECLPIPASTDGGIDATTADAAVDAGIDASTDSGPPG